MSAAPPNLGTFGVVVPEGWTLEMLPRQPHHALLSTPVDGGRYMATIDFRARGFRDGYSTAGRFIGEDWNKARKKYDGRGWRQVLVDDAVTHLRAVQAPGVTARHFAYVEADFESFRRGGSCRTAACSCGWRGPQRATLELVVDDALMHEREGPFLESINESSSY